MACLSLRTRCRTTARRSSHPDAARRPFLPSARSPGAREEPRGLRRQVAMTTTFFTAVVVLLLAAAAGGWVTRRLGLTQTVGELLPGAIVGPTVLGHVWPSLQHGLFPADVMPPLQLFSLLVVLIYVAQTAAEVDRGFLRGSGRRSIGIVGVGAALA